MSKQKVIVKNIDSIQNLGAMDILCTDKTGTLTQDRIVLKLHLDPHGKDCDEVLALAYLNSFHQTGLRSLLDVAVLEDVALHSAMKVESNFKKIDEIPFDFQRRRMSVVVEEENHHHELICKGALEEILVVCTSVKNGPTVEPLDDSIRQQVLRLSERLNNDGLRVIAVAYKEVPLQNLPYSLADEANLTFVGLIAFLDPPKDSAAAAIRESPLQKSRIIRLLRQRPCRKRISASPWTRPWTSPRNRRTSCCWRRACWCSMPA
jgi:Mg2+-importing ATPase